VPPARVVASGSFGDTLELQGVSVWLVPAVPVADSSGICDTGEPASEPRYIVGYRLRVDWGVEAKLHAPGITVGKEDWHATGFSDPFPFRGGIVYDVWTCNQDDDTGQVTVSFPMDWPFPYEELVFRFS
jgi:hypothetical protein